MKVEKVYDFMFDSTSSGRPYMVYPKVFSDSRGTFSEVLVGDQLGEVKQVNRSTSCQWTVRGCHAQRGKHCQAKLVEAITVPIYDIIVDARPDSKTFGLSNVYYLDPIVQNKLYVPRGFLHAFAVPQNSENADAVFMYYCDNVYNKDSEVCVNPMSIMPKIAKMMAQSKDEKMSGFINMMHDINKLVLSEKDLSGQDFRHFMSSTSEEYKDKNALWYA